MRDGVKLKTFILVPSHHRSEQGAAVSAPAAAGDSHVSQQSSWFPLYDRNPQKFVPNIMLAKQGDYVKATHRISHAGENASFVELPVTEEHGR